MTAASEWTEWAVSLTGNPGGYLTLNEREARELAAKHGADLFRRTRSVVYGDWEPALSVPGEHQTATKPECGPGQFRDSMSDLNVGEHQEEGKR